MSTIKHLTDFNAWQEARKLCKGIYVLTKKFPPEEKYNLTKHLRESGRGTASNVAEGFGRYFFKESLRFYGIARGCLEEVRSDLYISFDNGYVNKQELDRFMVQIDKVNALINGLCISTQNQMKTGKDLK